MLRLVLSGKFDQKKLNITFQLNITNHDKGIHSHRGFRVTSRRFILKDDILVLNLRGMLLHSPFPSQKLLPINITNLSYLIVSIANHSTIQNYCKCYNELIKRTGAHMIPNALFQNYN